MPLYASSGSYANVLHCVLERDTGRVRASGNLRIHCHRSKVGLLLEFRFITIEVISACQCVPDFRCSLATWADKRGVCKEKYSERRNFW
jgi:hypothetical protein